MHSKPEGGVAKEQSEEISHEAFSCCPVASRWCLDAEPHAAGTVLELEWLEQQPQDFQALEARQELQAVQR